MTMSRQDYELVAHVLRETGASRRTVISMASALAVGYPRFSVARFVDASTDENPAEWSELDHDDDEAQAAYDDLWGTIDTPGGYES